MDVINNTKMNLNSRNNFTCQVCFKVLSSRQGLLQHKNTHTGAKPYKCNYPNCCLAYRHASQLSNHKLVHKTLRRPVGKDFTDIKHFIKIMLLYFSSNDYQTTELPKTQKPLKVHLPKISFKEFSGKLPLAPQLEGLSN
jgi:hypothetical protein